MPAEQPSNISSEVLIGAWSHILSGSKIIYLSGPITTGPGYVALFRDRGTKKRLLQVKRQNMSDLQIAAQKLRKSHQGIVIEPSILNLPGWKQPDYHDLWAKLIANYARLVVFMPGWEYSWGCSLEFLQAQSRGIQTETLSGNRISLLDGIALLSKARDDLQKNRNQKRLLKLSRSLERVIAQLSELISFNGTGISHQLRKDKSLDDIAERGLNVAQFVGFASKDGKPRLTYSRLAGREPNGPFASLHEAIAALLNASSGGTINIRSYHPDDPRSREFIYGLSDLREAVAAIERLSAEGLYTIANETIDISDGGVSGVLQGDIIEFAPDDTPRCVEKPGTASLPQSWGRELLSTVYGTTVDFSVPLASRLEFSLHPEPRGWKTTNIVAWEYEPQQFMDMRPAVSWPNKFSQLIGDKTFGLLVAHHIGLPVPATTVINRRVAPFTFGRRTGWNEHWIRTAPREQMPGQYTTRRGWTDPFALLQNEDPSGSYLSSVLSQVGVRPVYSGALIVGANEELIIEGKAGPGDTFMLGERGPEPLTWPIIADIRELYVRAEAALGPVRFEWVHDGDMAWIVQLHIGATRTTHLRLVPGEAKEWMEFDVDQGLPSLRRLLANFPADTGIIVRGQIGLTSHLADVLRKAQVPARIAS